MTCPFLKETQVRHCQTASFRKLIPLAQDASALEKCSSPEYVACAIYRGQPVEGQGSATCPYLRETLVQYCAAVPVTRYLPYSESLNSRCGGDSHRYCELYLGMAHPDVEAHPVEGLAMPDWLRYSANHMWLDLTDDGLCHAGLDAFLCRALGEIEDVTFVKLTGRGRPAVVIRAAGLDLEMVFPNVFRITATNLYLRANPSRIGAQPYTGGWLFEGRPEADTTLGLKQGIEARAWMHDEIGHMNEYLQQATGAAADGGMFARDLAAHLDRGQMLSLFHEFFSLAASGKKEV